MAKQQMSKKKSLSLTFALFLIGLAILTYTQTWWPAIMLVIGLPLALRQYLIGRIYDMIITLVVFLGVFITIQFNIKWDILLPVLFTIGGIYIFFKEFFGPNKTTEIEEEKDVAEEIKEEEEEEEEEDKD